ncbi:MAG: CocE/NonD family hydrolase, partial [Terriglobales bacterium]
MTTPNLVIRVALSRLSKLLLVLLLPLLVAQAGFALDPPSPPTYSVRMQDTWIPMKDGVRLAVKLYMPQGAGQNEKFPAVLEYDPYRKDDATAERDYALYSYFVRRGYVCARVDIRGFGNSEGAPTDREYSE